MAEWYDNFISGAQMEDQGNFDAPLHNYGVPITRVSQFNPIYAEIKYLQTK